MSNILLIAINAFKCYNIVNENMRGIFMTQNELCEFFAENGISVDEYQSAYTHSDENYVYIDALDSIYDLGGIQHPNDNCGEYYRLDAAKKYCYSNANRYLATNTSGAQVRIATDASKVFVSVTLNGNGNGMHHFTDRGVYGVDFYQGVGKGREYVGGVMVTFAVDINKNEGVLALKEGVKEFYINLPLYEGVKKVEIGFPHGSRISRPMPRENGTVCFYGSSITQGGCAGRPGNMYSHILCRQLDCNNMNLGFSGSARGEQAVANYIASRHIDAFVMDFVFNTLTVGELEYTHEKFYKTVRTAHPDIPVIFVTHPYYGEATALDRERVRVVFETYTRAKENGENVWFVDSESFFPHEMRDLFAVDNLHPNDLGNYFMAKAIYPTLKKALEG